jgi:hypothetical protein
LPPSVKKYWYDHRLLCSPYCQVHWQQYQPFSTTRIFRAMSTPKREPSIEISQSRKYAHRCMFCRYPYRSNEKTSVSHNKNQKIRGNENGWTVPSAC